MDIILLLSITKMIAASIFVIVSIVLLLLAFRSTNILKSLELMDTAVHGATAAILSQGSMILATVLPILIRAQAKSNIWVQLFKMSSLSKNRQIIKLIKPISDLTELAQQASLTFKSLKGLF